MSSGSASGYATRRPRPRRRPWEGRRAMAVRDIVVIDHPVLRRKAKKIVKITAEHRKLIEDMIETMRQAPGVGLAAPQVGIGERLITIEWADEPETEEAPPPKKKLYVVLN